MSRELALDRIVTEFLLNTCRPCPPSRNKRAITGALYSGTSATVQPDDDDDADNERTALITGSATEFYIEPMLPHVGDVDVMFYLNNTLAIPRGHPPPTQLPADFHTCVKVVEIIDSHFPGYVYLSLHYLLTQSTDDDKYNTAECETGLYVSNILPSITTNIHGPAAVLHVPSDRPEWLSVDQVRCIRCHGRHKPLIG